MRRARRLVVRGLARLMGARSAAWDILPCPGCGRPVAFLPGQHANTCAWCSTTVER